MGNLIFRRKKVTAEELEELTKRYQLMKEDIRKAMLSKKSVQCFLTLVFIVGILFSIALSFIHVSDNIYRIIYSLFSLFTGAIVIYGSYSVTESFYGWSIGRKESACIDLMRKKRELIEKIKETETFKVAKEILEKYDASFAQTPQGFPDRPNDARIDTAQNLFNSGNRRRTLPNGILAPQHLTQASPSKSLSLTGAEKPPNMPNSAIKNETTLEKALAMHRPPRPFYNQQRGIADKIIDYILGDGPNSRFALICSHCFGHNGMAKEEEFEFVSYRCWICGEFNPARRQRVSVNSMNFPVKLEVAQSVLPPAIEDKKNLTISEEKPHVNQASEEETSTDDESTNSLECNGAVKCNGVAKCNGIAEFNDIPECNGVVKCNGVVEFNEKNVVHCN